ncbi:hypothetical protein [Persephonella sp.]
MTLKTLLIKFLSKDYKSLTEEEIGILLTELKKIIHFALSDFLEKGKDGLRSPESSNYLLEILMREYSCWGNEKNKKDLLINEISHELIIKLYEKKHLILKIINQKENSYISGYIKRIVINNLLKDKVLKYKLENDEFFSMISIDSSRSEEKRSLTESIPDKKFNEKDLLMISEAEELIKHIKNNLTTKEKKVLCLDEYNLEECVSGDSKDSIYKGRERYKKKIKSILLENKFSEDVYRYIVEKEILMSEICKKLCLDQKERK